jgi:hypothetical protein
MTTAAAGTLTGTYHLDAAHSRIRFVAGHAMITGGMRHGHGPEAYRPTPPETAGFKTEAKRNQPGIGQTPNHNRPTSTRR